MSTNPENLETAKELLGSCEGYVLIAHHGNEDDIKGRLMMDMAPSNVLNAFSAFCNAYGNMYADLHPECPPAPAGDGISGEVASRDMGLAVAIMETMKKATGIEQLNLATGVVMSICTVLANENPEILNFMQEIVDDAKAEANKRVKLH